MLLGVRRITTTVDLVLTKHYSKNFEALCLRRSRLAPSAALRSTSRRSFSNIQSQSGLLTINTSKLYHNRLFGTMTTFPKWGKYPCAVSATNNFEDERYDTVLLIAPHLESLKEFAPNFFKVLDVQAQIDNAVEREGAVLPLGNGRRLVYSPATVENDYDDARSYSDASSKGIKRALSAGSKKVLLIVVPHAKVPNSKLVAVLGAFEALYVPLQYREDVPDKATKLTELGISSSSNTFDDFFKLAFALESGRFVARDLGGGDPERMAPPRFAQYVEQVFKDTPIEIEVIDDHSVMEKEYPLFAAVNRAANAVERHRGRIIYLTYNGEGPITRTLLLCGKGITYDTGGADIKAGGIMAGMSRDKCGASAVAGFFQTLVALRPKGVKVIGALAVARNSVGEECYVADEILTSRAGVRVRIGNTDAEGRMVMSDPLCRLKELALNEVNPHLMTIATLTGHACLAVGNYTAVMDNGPAKAEEFAQKLQRSGEVWGDMFEISTIRREDYKFVKSSADGEDLLQCNAKPSSATPRGHQFPAAFMVLAAGLDKHGVKSKQPLKYSHLDIAGSSGHVPDVPTGVPILALTKFVLDDM